MSGRVVDGCARGRGLAGAAGVAVSQDGRNVYVASNGSNAVVGFRRDDRSGALAQLPGRAGCTSESGSAGCASGQGLTGAFSIAVSPDDRNVYVASFQGVAVFARDARTGALTQLSGTDACVAENGDDGCVAGRGLNSAASVTVSPNGANVYVASTNSSAVVVFARDPGTGALRQLSGMAGCTNEYGTEGCQQGGALGGAFSVAVAPDGKYVYAAALSSSAIAVFQRDSVDGELSELTGPSGCIGEGGGPEGCSSGHGISGPNAVVIAPGGTHLYAASSGSSAVAALLRNQDNGELDQRQDANGCTAEGGTDGCATGRGLDGAYALAISPEGKSLYVAALDSIAVFARYPASGRLLQIAGRQGCLDETGQDGCASARGISGASSVAISPDGRSLYVAALQSDAVAVFARTTEPDRLRARLAGIPKRCTARPFTVRVTVRSTLPLNSLTLSLDRRRLAHSVRHVLRRQVPVRRLASGGHRLVVTAIDQAGHRVSRAARFTRCG